MTAKAIMTAASETAAAAAPLADALTTAGQFWALHAWLAPSCVTVLQATPALLAKVSRRGRYLRTSGQTFDRLVDAILQLRSMTAFPYQLRNKLVYRSALRLPALRPHVTTSQQKSAPLPCLAPIPNQLRTSPHDAAHDLHHRYAGRLGLSRLGTPPRSHANREAPQPSVPRASSA